MHWCPRFFTLGLVTLTAHVPWVTASFYENPEVKLPPDAGTPLFHLEKKWGTDWGFQGISTFAHLQHIRCLMTPYELFDVGIIGAPFDTAVSYRPGARFGPRAIRAASARQTSFRGFNHRAHFNPYKSWPRILDCGDIPITPFDNALALQQMEDAYGELLSRRPLSHAQPPSHLHPKLITLGGDHSVALPALRALKKVYKQPIAVLHFDAHLDTWHPGKYPATWASSPTQADFNHGSMFWLAVTEGLVANSSSVHAGLRTRLAGEDFSDYADDTAQGFLRIESDDIDEFGVAGIVDLILARIGTEIPVYLSIDIDVIDPGLAPGTGTPEPGGWTTRELIQILRGIEDLNVVGADVVEVSPAYDGTGETTALAAAQVVYEMLTSVVKKGVKERGEWHDMVKPDIAWKDGLRRKLRNKNKNSNNKKKPVVQQQDQPEDPVPVAMPTPTSTADSPSSSSTTTTTAATNGAATEEKKEPFDASKHVDAQAAADLASDLLGSIGEAIAQLTDVVGFKVKALGAIGGEEGKEKEKEGKDEL